MEKINFPTSIRSHTCGILKLDDQGSKVTLTGWIQSVRDLGGITFIDLRDRYGITQLVFYHQANLIKQGVRRHIANFDQYVANLKLFKNAKELKREFVIGASGYVVERENKNDKIETGSIEVVVTEFEVLNASKVPPFTIEDETDGGEELRMRYRYLDLRRNPLRRNLELRHRMAIETRNYMDSQGFLEIETPVLIKSTPEGARDFVVPSRVHTGKFYALPQSPQTFKQILMVAGYDRYYQIVRCFRDEDLRADRQPEFTQIDCEMAFVTQEDILNTFEGLARHLFRKVKGYETGPFTRMTFADAMKYYGSDKPDIRFGMKFTELNELVKGKGFGIFEDAELVVGICAEGCAEYSRKQLDELTEFVKRPQIGAKGMVYLQHKQDGTIKSSVDKFYSPEDLQKIAKAFDAQPGDLILVLAGDAHKTRKALNELRLEMGSRLKLRDPNTFKPLWVVDFPLLEWDEESRRFYAMHHPFTSPKPEDIPLLNTDPGKVRANAYDLVINGVEIGGGSIRIHHKDLQKKMFQILGFTDEEAQNQFGFLMNAFEYGAPPHGGIAFGFDRWTAMFGGVDSIREVIAFPKNNAGQDMMIDSPSEISDEQLKELHLAISTIAKGLPDAH